MDSLSSDSLTLLKESSNDLEKLHDDRINELFIAEELKNGEMIRDLIVTHPHVNVQIINELYSLASKYFSDVSFSFEKTFKLCDFILYTVDFNPKIKLCDFWWTSM
jgi:hypothetical protein